MEIYNNMVINRQALGLTTMNIKANVSGSVKSVKFALNANANFRTENSAPYAMCGDQNAIYATCNELVAGTFSIQAIPFSLAGATGSTGQSMTLTFTIVDGNPTIPAPVLPPVTVPAPVSAPVAVPAPVTVPAPVPVIPPVHVSPPVPSPVVVPAPVAAPVSMPIATPGPVPVIAGPPPVATPVSVPVPAPVSPPVIVPTLVVAPVVAPMALPPILRTDGLTNLRLINIPNQVVMDLKLNGEPNYVTGEVLGLKNLDFNIMALGTEGIVSVTFDNGRSEKAQPFARCGDSNGIFQKCGDISGEGQFTVSATGKLFNGANSNTISATIIIQEKGTAAPSTSAAPSFSPTTAAPTASAAPTMTKTCNTPKVGAES
jgi:hypothetical protein